MTSAKSRSSQSSTRGTALGVIVAASRSASASVTVRSRLASHSSATSNRGSDCLSTRRREPVSTANTQLETPPPSGVTETPSGASTSPRAHR